jgi:hypothetical protein
MDGGETPIRDDRYDDLVAEGSNTATSPRQATSSARNDATKSKPEQKKLPVGQVAAKLRDGPVILALHAVGMGRDLPIEAWRLYLDEFVRQAGNPSDPVEKLMVEQLALAHNAITKLYVRAASAEDAATSELCFAALARLAAEFRRLALALHVYRGPASPKIVNVVGQQNLAVAGDQQIANLEGTVATSPGKNSLTAELTSNNHPRLEHEVQQQFTVQPAAGGRRETEPTEAPRSDARGTAAAERSRACQPPMAESDGTTIGER